jgi:hypothetical protein
VAEMKKEKDKRQSFFCGFVVQVLSVCVFCCCKCLFAEVRLNSKQLSKWPLKATTSSSLETRSLLSFVSLSLVPATDFLLLLRSDKLDCPGVSSLILCPCLFVLLPSSTATHDTHKHTIEEWATHFPLLVPRPVLLPPSRLSQLRHPRQIDDATIPLRHMLPVLLTYARLTPHTFTRHTPPHSTHPLHHHHHHHHQSCLASRSSPMAPSRAMLPR